MLLDYVLHVVLPYSLLFSGLMNSSSIHLALLLMTWGEGEERGNSRWINKRTHYLLFPLREKLSAQS